MHRSTPDFSRPPGFRVAGLFALSLPLLASAQIERQHGAHVHGEATGTLAQDDKAVELRLEIPGVNLVGFERPPRDSGESEVLQETLQRLEQGDWLRPDQAGDCTLAELTVTTPGFGDLEEAGREGDHHEPDHQGHDDSPDDSNHGPDRDDEHVHDHDNGHDHDIERDQDHHHGNDHDHEHAEIHLTAVLECESVESLRWVDLELFEPWPGNERVNIQYFTDRGQGQVRLQPGRTRIQPGR